MIGAAAVIAFVVTAGIFIPAIGAIVERARTPASVEPTSLPDQVLVCARSYIRAAEPATLTFEEARTRDGRDPVVVSGAPDLGCPAGVCVEGDMCLPVVYVVAGSDRYVAFELEGGP